MTIHYNICICAFIDISIYHSDLSFNQRLTNKDLQRKLNMSFAGNTDKIYRQHDTRLQSMFYQRQLQPVITSPMPTTDTFMNNVSNMINNTLQMDQAQMTTYVINLKWIYYYYLHVPMILNIDLFIKDTM